MLVCRSRDVLRRVASDRVVGSGRSTQPDRSQELSRSKSGRGPRHLSSHGRLGGVRCLYRTVESCPREHHIYEFRGRSVREAARQLSLLATTTVVRIVTVPSWATPSLRTSRSIFACSSDGAAMTGLVDATQSTTSSTLICRGS